jgi:hypothetical protein
MHFEAKKERAYDLLCLSLRDSSRMSTTVFPKDLPPFTRIRSVIVKAHKSAVFDPLVEVLDAAKNGGEKTSGNSHSRKCPSNRTKSFKPPPNYFPP